MYQLHKFILAVLIGFLSQAVTLDAQNWTQKQDFPYYKLNNGEAFSIGDYGYVGLGDTSVNNGSQLGNRFFRYDPSVDTWQEIAPFPGRSRTGAVSFSLNGFGYVGLGRTSDSTFSDFYRYDPQTNNWTTLNPFPGGARSGACEFVIDGVAYIGAGYKGSSALGYANDLWKYIPASDSWELLNNGGFPARSNCSAFAINGKGYVVGGTSDVSILMFDLQEYNPQTNTWTKRLDAQGVALAFTGAPSFVVDGLGYMMYGNKNFCSYYDPVTNQAVVQGDFLNINTNRGGAVAFAVNGKGYFGTGAQFVSDPALSGNQRDIWEYTAPVNVTAPELAGLTLEVLPNPATDLVQVLLPSAPDGPYTLQLMDENGRLVQEQNGEVTGGVLQAQIPVSQRASGVYYLAARMQGLQIVRALVIAR